MGHDEESEDIEDGIKAFRERLQQKQAKAMEQAKLAQLNVDNLSATSSEGEEENERVDGDKVDEFNIDDEESNLQDWIETQKRLKQATGKDDEDDEYDSDDEPLVVDGDMDVEEANNPYFSKVHDATYKIRSAMA